MTNQSLDLSSRAATLHHHAIVIDALDVSRFDEARFRKMQQGGVTAANATVVMPHLNFRDTVDGIRDFDRLIERHADLVMPVRSVADIYRAKETGKVGLIYGFQNAVAIEGDPELVGVFHCLGVRIIQLTYMTANYIGDGCLEPRNGGLTIFGRAVVEEMNRIGILIDLAHVGQRTTRDAIDRSEKPVAFSHACARGLVDHPRNKTDEEIRALAARGGVMGITSLPEFVCDFMHGEEATIEHYLRQIDYVANLAGVDHVGIGMDYIDGQPEGFAYGRNWGGAMTQRENLPLPQIVARLAGSSGDAAQQAAAQSFTYDWPLKYAVRDSSCLPQITEGLLARGYAETDIQRVLGGNWLRLFEQVW